MVSASRPVGWLGEASPSRSPRGYNPACLSTQPVTHSTHVRQRRGTRGIEFRPKTREMRLEPFRIGIALLGPARAQERATFEHLARARDQCRQQTELRGREVERI